MRKKSSYCFQSLPPPSQSAPGGRCNLPREWQESVSKCDLGSLDGLSVSEPNSHAKTSAWATQWSALSTGTVSPPHCPRRPARARAQVAWRSNWATTCIGLEPTAPLQPHRRKCKLPQPPKGLHDVQAWPPTSPLHPPPPLSPSLSALQPPVTFLSLPHTLLLYTCSVFCLIACQPPCFVCTPACTPVNTYSSARSPPLRSRPGPHRTSKVPSMGSHITQCFL